MNKASIKRNLLATLVLSTVCYNAHAASFRALPEQNALLGNPEIKKHVKAHKSETLLDIARAHDLGQNQIVWANKKVDRWLPSKPVKKTLKDKDNNEVETLGKGKDILIPNSYILPKVEREGIVLNLPEYRLYYYHNGQVITHPISIGRQNWNTPIGRTRIIKKTKNPTWTPPASIRREHAAQGEILPAVWPAGPNNPLGLYKMNLGLAGYLIHSTNKPLGVGMRVSHGCIRMYPEDIERIFPSIKEGTVVQILNDPIKVGWSDNGLYISVHPDLDDARRSEQERLQEALNLIEEAKTGEMIQISGSLLKKALKERNGIPVALYKGTRRLPSPPSLINNIQPTPVSQNSPPLPSKKSSTPRLLRAQQQAAGMLPPPKNRLTTTPSKQGLKTSLAPKKEGVKKTLVLPKKETAKAQLPAVKKARPPSLVQKKTIPVPKKAQAAKLTSKTAQVAPKKKPPSSSLPRIKKTSAYNTGKPSLKTTKPQQMTRSSLPPKPPRLASPVKKKRVKTVPKTVAPTLNAKALPPKVTSVPRSAVKSVNAKSKPPLPRLHKKSAPEFSILKGAR